MFLKYPKIIIMRFGENNVLCPKYINIYEFRGVREETKQIPLYIFCLLFKKCKIQGTFGTLELLFPIFKKEFVFVLFQFPNTIVRNFLLRNKMHHLDMILFRSNMNRSFMVLRLHTTYYLANHRMVSYLLNSIFKLK